MSIAAIGNPTLPRSLNVVDRLARRVVTKQLAGLTRGEIILRDASSVSVLGEASDLQVSLRVHRPRFFRQAVMGGKLSVAESYLRGDWDCDDLTSLCRIFVRNRNSGDGLDRGFSRLASYGHKLFHWLNDNTRDGSRRNIAAHYDLGNDFYRLWLDETMAYSSGIFTSPDTTLHEASVEKFDRVCRKLDFQPDSEVLEIGTGWGGFALHAAENYGCHVTTTTISNEQFGIAQQRIWNAGLSEQISLLKQDYRDLQGQFDKLVSIEMIEAVGHKHLDGYFKQCGQLLRPDGSLVIQAIVMPEHGYRRYLQSVDFIQRYVFPGGSLPSMEAMLGAAGRQTDLRFVHAEDFGPHYAETLRRWRVAFQNRLDDVRQLGYSEEFIRLWNYYLCYCEAAFEERYVGVIQIQFDKPECRRDPINLSRQSANFWQPPGIVSARSSREPVLCGNGERS